MQTLNKRVYSIMLILLIGGFVLAGSELLAPSPSHSAQEFSEASYVKAAPEHATLFNDTFDGGTTAWNLDGTWVITNESGDNVLDGQGHGWAWLKTGQNWTDYTLTADIKMITGAIQLMVRFTEDHGRYIIGITPGGMYLRKESPWGKFSTDLDTDATGFSFNTWYNIVVEANSSRIRVLVNGLERINYKDISSGNSWPLYLGTIGMEVVPDASAHARFDDINIWGTVSPEQTWIRTGGPIGGLGYDIRFGATTQQMFVTDNYSGVFKSSNNGQSWYPSNRGITGRFWPSGDAIPVFTLNLDDNNAANSTNIVWLA